jgi:hypothetical protein
MKVILSRKGCDSGEQSGQMASPILPCGCLCSIPIPYSSGVSYAKIWFGKRTLPHICHGIKADWKSLAHLDPDLCLESLAIRPPGWRAAFGQSSAAQGHLKNQEVGKGDLFLFFGWFKRTEGSGDKLKFVSGDPGRHIIYGWLQVGQVVDVSDPTSLPADLRFLAEHPHVKFRKLERGRNAIYVSAHGGLGAGLFKTISEELVLTKEGSHIRSEWRLPSPAFKSVFEKQDLSYHSRTSRWSQSDGCIELTAVSRGQEFVFDGTSHPTALEHCVHLIKSELSRTNICEHDN